MASTVLAAPLPGIRARTQVALVFVLNPCARCGWQHGRVPHLVLTYQDALLGAALLAAAGALGLFVPVRRRAVVVAAAAAREASLVVALFALWQIVGGHAHTKVEGAFEHAHTVFRLEQAVHLPSEVSLQRLVLPHPWLVHIVDTYYTYGHFNVMIGVLAWLFLRHRDRYPRVRNVVVITTGLCLAVQLVPVAPPRMLTDLGFVDVALQYGESVYGANGSGIAPQLAAMPSVHVAWCVIVGVVVFRSTTSRWRWLAPVHAVLMTLVVVVTANHWWADGIVAAALMGIAFGVVLGGEALARRFPRLTPATIPAQPAPAASQARVADDATV